MRPFGRCELRDPKGARHGIRAEIRATLGLATPLAVANLAQMAMGVTNTLMVGRLGAVPLAAAGLGGMLFFTFGIMLQGIPFAVAPLSAHALGAGDRGAAGRIAGAGLALAVLLALPFVVVLTRLDRGLLALGYDPQLAQEIGRYLRALAWGAPAFLGIAVLRSLLAALSRTAAVMAVLLTCVVGNAALNWVLIWGRLGAPALGMAGSGYASAVNQWLILVGLALCLQTIPGVAALHVWRNMFRAGRTQIAAILRLGLPIGLLRGIEVGLFACTGVLMGLLGAAALGAHQLVINCAGISFMVPLGLSQAATVRVAYELGAGRVEAARRAGFLAITLGIGFMAAAALVLLRFPQAIIAAYVDVTDPANRETIEIARQLIVIAALFQVFDGIQVIAAGALRGYKDTMAPMLLATCGYWGVGFGGGWLFAFRLGHGPVGLWWGLALGLAVVSLLLTLRLHRLAPAISRPVRAVAAP
jgi:MATE family multidrug resistance protein